MAKTPAPSPVFQQTYRRYLEDLKGIHLNDLAGILDIAVENNTAVIPIFGKPYRVSADGGVLDEDNKRPDFSICVVLLKYLLLCPPEVPAGEEWVGFKDFRDAAPLFSYFSQNVQGVADRRFSGRKEALVQAAQRLGGSRPEESYPFDVAMVLAPLPRVPVLLLFNDADEEFPARSNLLFERRAEQFLDPECLAIAGWLTVEALMASA